MNDRNTSAWDLVYGVMSPVGVMVVTAYCGGCGCGCTVEVVEVEVKMRVVSE
jgi:hypothetical protein